MGEKQIFQPLTREDRTTVVLYRIGIGLSTVLIALAALLLAREAAAPSPAKVDLLLYGLYGAVGLSVFFIHLYIGKLKQYLKGLYVMAVGCLGLLLFLGSGSPAAVLLHRPLAALLLLPLSGCLGFVTAKEAFCFRLLEGYLLAMIMPVLLLLVAGGALDGRSAAGGLVLVASLLVLFSLRKLFMPLAYDIGDKSAYQ
jgi:uncharacterized integral membrane protein